MRFVTVADPRNAPDRDAHGQGRFGAVDDVFQIADQKVTHLEYARFLNAAAQTDPAGLYHPFMACGPGAIRRVASDGAYRYQVRDGERATPVSGVSWSGAARYCNWLHNGRPVGPQGPDTTEDGAYGLADGSRAATRRFDAKYFLPTADEWHKAAYYDPGRPDPERYGHYRPSDTDRPRIVQADPDRVSPWGMIGFADKAWEWTESPVGALHRAVRSGAWFQGNNKQAAGHFYVNPEIRDRSLGFRVARPSVDRADPTR